VARPGSATASNVLATGAGAGAGAGVAEDWSQETVMTVSTYQENQTITHRYSAFERTLHSESNALVRRAKEGAEELARLPCRSALQRF